MLKKFMTAGALGALALALPNLALAEEAAKAAASGGMGWGHASAAFAIAIAAAAGALSQGKTAVRAWPSAPNAAARPIAMAAERWPHPAPPEAAFCAS